MRLTGGCLCGHIRFAAEGMPDNPQTCSCHMFQRDSGAPTNVWVPCSKGDVSWTGPGGAPAVWRSSGVSSRALCPVCGSTLGAVDDWPTIGLVSRSFGRPNLVVLAPVSHSYTASRPKRWCFGSGETRNGGRAPTERLI